MSSVELKVSVKLSWWVRYYVCSVLLFAQMTGKRPDLDKVMYWVGKGVSLKVK